MTTLIIGGASLIGTELAHLLKAAGRDVLFTSRSGRGIPEGLNSVKFDWYDASTFTNPFATGSKIDSVYLLPPTGNLDPLNTVAPFIDLAIEKGVKRYVLLTMSASVVGDEYGLTKVQKYLDDKGVDYFVVKPTWFTENFSRVYGYGIRANGEFSTSVPTAKLPFVAGKDIAQAAYEAIVNEKNDVKEKLVIGPELLTYDEAAAILSDALGKKVTHKAVPKADIVQQLTSVGLPPDYINFLVGLHELAEGGSEERLAKELKPERIHVGKITVREWAENNKASFA